MPAAPRPNKKAQKILEAIIGTPANMVKVRLNKESKRIRELLDYRSNRLQR